MEGIAPRRLIELLASPQAQFFQEPRLLNVFLHNVNVEIRRLPFDGKVGAVGALVGVQIALKAASR
jgi:hypothetical protein